MSARLETQALVLRAEDAPLSNQADRSACRRYRRPQLSLEARELGALAPDHLRVEMLYAGVCGTDLHLLQSDPATGYIRTSAPTVIPPQGRVIGHEGVGRVIEKGADVSAPPIGTVVGFASILACMRCQICRRGDFNQCPHAALLGMEVDGLFGSTVDVPASIAHDISAMGNGDAIRAASCLEPAAVALLACERANVSPGDCVTVFGGGPIGLFAAMIAKRVRGATQVSLIEPLSFRREFAAAWCDATYDIDAYCEAQREADVVIEASGDLTNISRSFRRIKANGRVVLLGRQGMPLNIDNVDHMITQAISILGSRGHLGGFIAKAAALHRAGLLPLDAPITGEVSSLAALHHALQDPDGLARQHCKLIARIGPDH